MFQWRYMIMNLTGWRRDAPFWIFSQINLFLDVCIIGRYFLSGFNASLAVYYDCINVYLLIAKKMTFLNIYRWIAPISNVLLNTSKKNMKRIFIIKSFLLKMTSFSFISSLVVTFSPPFIKLFLNWLINFKKFRIFWSLQTYRKHESLTFMAVQSKTNGNKRYLLIFNNILPSNIKNF